MKGRVIGTKYTEKKSGSEKKKETGYILDTKKMKKPKRHLLYESRDETESKRKIQYSFYLQK